MKENKSADESEGANWIIMYYAKTYEDQFGCFLEDFVEKEHQTGKLEDKRTGNMGNKNQQASSNSRHEWARKMVPKIKLERDRIKSQLTSKRRKRRRASFLAWNLDNRAKP